MENLLLPFAGERSSRIAERLIRRFGSPGGVVFASPRQLEEAGGEDRDVCALISAARELVETGLREELIGSPVDLADPRFVLYLKLRIGQQQQECLYAVFVDREQRYILGEPIGIGGRVGVDTRMGHLFRRAVELRSTGLVLAHNHPSGRCRPSQADLAATARIDETAARLDIRLIDHLIVTRSAVYSIKQGRLL